MGCENISAIIPLFIFSATTVLLSSLLSWINSVISSRQRFTFTKYINERFIKKNAQLDIAVFDVPQYYNILDEAERSKSALFFVVYRVTHFFNFIISLSISLYIILSYKEKYIGLIIILFVLPSLLNKGKYYNKLYQYDVQTRPLSRKVSYCARILFDRNAAQEIRFFNLKDYLLDKYSNNTENQIAGKKKIIYKYGLVDSFLNTLPVVGVMFAILVVTKNILSGDGQVGDFVYFVGVFSQFKNNLTSLVEDIAKLNESEYAIRKFKEYMKLEPLVIKNNKYEIDKIESIEFKHVYFKYPNSDKYALEDIEFSIRIPEKIAIVGLNGAGKTTLVKLMLRFYDVDSGEILINGINIKKIHIDKLRKLVSPAFQDSRIYSMSLRFNVAMADLDNQNDDEKIMSKLELFQLNELASPELLDKCVTKDFEEDGIMLSGGQKQKLTLARFAFADSDLFIMDEPTAALDPLSEEKIFCELKKAYQDKGMIIISHRLSNIVDVDNIIVLKDSRIVEQGLHRELYEKKGLYFDMFNKQGLNYINN